MKSSPSVSYCSAAACRLVEQGDGATLASLRSAVGQLPDNSLRLLEEELDLFIHTGLVGILLSQLLSVLFRVRTEPLAA
jgi:hypothetical protein